MSMDSAFCVIVAGAIGLYYLLVYSYGATGWLLVAPVTPIAIGFIWLYLVAINTTPTPTP
jgi:hypothetical protein